VHHELRTFPDADTVARAAADFVAERSRQSIDTKGHFTFAVSAGEPLGDVREVGPDGRGLG